MKESGVSLLGVLFLLLVLSFLILGFKLTITQQSLLFSYREKAVKQYFEEKEKLLDELRVFSSRESFDENLIGSNKWMLPYSSKNYESLHKSIEIQDGMFLVGLHGFSFKKKAHLVEDLIIESKLMDSDMMIRVFDGQDVYVFNVPCENECGKDQTPLLINRISNVGYLIVFDGYFWMLSPFFAPYRVGKVASFKKYIASYLDDFNLSLFLEYEGGVKLDQYKIDVETARLSKVSTQTIVKNAIMYHELLQEDFDGVTMIVNSEGLEKEMLVAVTWDGLPLWGDTIVWSKKDLITSCGEGETIFEPYIGWKIGCEAAIKIWVLSQDL